MKIKIYLNDGEDHFFGFVNKFANSPELTMVHSFEISETEQAFVNRLPGPQGMIHVLEYVFEHTNLRTETLGKAFSDKMLRSVSVGDVVVIGEMAWACESVGWERITTEQLNNAIIWDDEIGGLPNAG